MDAFRNLPGYLNIKKSQNYLKIVMKKGLTVALVDGEEELEENWVHTYYGVLHGMDRGLGIK